MNSLFRLTLLILTCSLTACSETEQSTNPTEDHQNKKQSIQYQDASVHYETFGKGDLTLLFIHGWCIDHTYWLEQVKSFQSEYKVVTMDLPGFGESTAKRENWTIEKYAQDA